MHVQCAYIYSLIASFESRISGNRILSGRIWRETEYSTICVLFRDEDIEGDFDPAEYDRRMQELFENYDNTNADDEKPEFSDLEVIKLIDDKNHPSEA